jgi:hypothetical protein
MIERTISGASFRYILDVGWELFIILFRLAFTVFLAQSLDLRAFFSKKNIDLVTLLADPKRHAVLEHAEEFLFEGHVKVGPAKAVEVADKDDAGLHEFRDPGNSIEKIYQPLDGLVRGLLARNVQRAAKRCASKTKQTKKIAKSSVEGIEKYLHTEKGTCESQGRRWEICDDWFRLTEQRLAAGRLADVDELARREHGPHVLEPNVAEAKLHAVFQSLGDS